MRWAKNLGAAIAGVFALIGGLAITVWLCGLAARMTS